MIKVLILRRTLAQRTSRWSAAGGTTPHSFSSGDFGGSRTYVDDILSDQQTEKTQMHMYIKLYRISTLVAYEEPT